MMILLKLILLAKDPCCTQCEHQIQPSFVLTSDDHMASNAIILPLMGCPVEPLHLTLPWVPSAQRSTHNIIPKTCGSPAHIQLGDTSLCAKGRATESSKPCMDQWCIQDLRWVLRTLVSADASR